LFLAHHPVKTFSGLNIELKQVPLPDELSLAEPARVSPGFKGSSVKSSSEKKNPKWGDQPGERSSQRPVNSGSTVHRLDEEVRPLMIHGYLVFEWMRTDLKNP